MSVDRAALFPRLAAERPAPGGTAGALVVAEVVAIRLAAGPEVARGEARATLDALCRQIDVRKRVSAAYGPEWARLDPEPAADAWTIAALAAVLLGNATAVGRGRGDDDEGWGLKCVNSALKALDLRDDLPHAPALRAWALEVLDRAAAPESGAG
jgi:hypothetical protein